MVRSFRNTSGAATTIPAGLLSSMILAGTALVSPAVPSGMESRPTANPETHRIHLISAFTDPSGGHLQTRTWSVETSSTYKPDVVQTETLVLVPADRVTGSATTVLEVVEFVDSATKNPFDAHHQIETSKWLSIEHNMARWRKLSPGWDGASAVPPETSSLDAMKDFVSKLRQLDIAPPSTMISADGELTIHWDSNAGYAHISFLSDGHIIGIVRRKGQRSIEFDEPYDSYQLDSHLYSSLKALA